MFLATINVADITSVIWQQQLLSLTQLVFFGTKIIVAGIAGVLCNNNYCRWQKMYFSQRKSYFCERYKLLLYLLYLNNKIVGIN
jgi:hypothetical protein